MLGSKAQPTHAQTTASTRQERMMVKNNQPPSTSTRINRSNAAEDSRACDQTYLKCCRGLLSTYHKPLTFLVFQDILDGTQTVFLGAPTTPMNKIHCLVFNLCK